MTIKDINPPSAEPIDLPYAKTFLRVDYDADDSLITDLITSAREQLESLIRGTLITRRRLHTSDSVRYGFYVNHSPVTAVHRVAVVSEGGAVTDVPMADLTVNLRSTPPAICLNNCKRWTDYADDAVAVEVELDAGYGDVGEIPMPLKQALLLLLGQAYENRDGREMPAIPMMVDALTMPYRGVRL